MSCVYTATLNSVSDSSVFSYLLFFLVSAQVRLSGAPSQLHVLPGSSRTTSGILSFPGGVTGAVALSLSVKAELWLMMSQI